MFIGLGLTNHAQGSAGDGSPPSSNFLVWGTGNFLVWGTGNFLVWS